MQLHETTHLSDFRSSVKSTFTAFESYQVESAMVLKTMASPPIVHSLTEYMNVF